MSERTNTGTSSGRQWPPSIPLTVLLALAAGLLFQGTRGLWEPDEGFYANVGLGMARSHDWIVPRLNGAPFLDKPPLVYWSVAAGIRALGADEWGARLAHALWFAASVAFVAAAASRLVDRAAGRWAGVVYATSLLPFLAANVVTPDTILAACVAAAGLAYISAEHDPPESQHAGKCLLFGVAAGLGVLAKGPAVAVFLAPLAVDVIVRRGILGALRRPSPWIALATVAAVGLPWYATIVRELPGAATYFWENQVSQRLFTATLHRNEKWYGPIVVYVPAIVVGFLPWTALWPRLWRRAGAPGLRRALAIARDDVRVRLLALWIVLPLAVLAMARSRLPLYALPLAVPIAIATGWALSRGPAPRPRAVAAIAAVFLAIKAGAAFLPMWHDTRAFARRLEALVGRQNAEVVCVDTKRNALPFYGFPDVMSVTTDPTPYPFYSHLQSLDEALAEMASEGTRHIVVAPGYSVGPLTEIIDDRRLNCTPKGSIDRNEILICGP